MQQFILNAGQQAAYDAILSGANVFLTGEGGTGKSVVVQQAVEELKHRGNEVVVCAPTGIAAQAVRGATINSAFQFDFSPKVADVLRDIKVSKVVAEADTIIIDEIGMVRRDMMDAIARVVEKANSRRPKKAAPLQLVVVGDFSQLPPVVTGEDLPALEAEYGDGAGFYAFEAAGWYRMGFQVRRLTEPMRQSAGEFVDMLNLARVGDASCIPYFNSLIEKNGEAPEDAVRLVGTNRAADTINHRFLAALPGEERVFKGEVSGKFDKRSLQVPKELRLKVGARVILAAGDSSNGYVNGSTGTVTALRATRDGKTGIGVRLDDGPNVVVQRHTWENNRYVVRDDGSNRKLDKVANGTYTQFPIKLAWALTFHKSQGQTLDSVQISPDSFAPGQLYVGLSRATRPDGLWLTRPLTERDLICSQSVSEFYHDGCDVAGRPVPKGIAAYAPSKKSAGAQIGLFDDGLMPESAAANLDGYIEQIGRHASKPGVDSKYPWATFRADAPKSKPKPTVDELAHKLADFMTSMPSDLIRYDYETKQFVMDPDSDFGREVARYVEEEDVPF